MYRLSVIIHGLLVRSGTIVVHYHITNTVITMQILAPAFLVPVHRSRRLARSVLPMHASPPPRTSLSPHSPEKRDTQVQSQVTLLRCNHIIRENVEVRTVFK